MIIKKDIYDTVSCEEMTELKLCDGILDVSSFLYRCPSGFGKLPHVYEIIDFLFRNELIIKNIRPNTFWPSHTEINFHIILYVGTNVPSKNIHNKKDKFTTISFNDDVFEYILDNYAARKVLTNVKDLIK